MRRKKTAPIDGEMTPDTEQLQEQPITNDEANSIPDVETTPHKAVDQEWLDAQMRSSVSERSGVTVGLEVGIVKLREDAKIPEFAHNGDACADIFANVFLKKYSAMNTELSIQEDASTVFIGPGERILVGTGFVLNLGHNMVAEIDSRSGMALKNGVIVANAPGIGDSGYRGEYGVILLNTSKTPYAVSKGDKISQIRIYQYIPFQFKQQDKIETTERGSGGFGSTGK